MAPQAGAESSTDSTVLQVPRRTISLNGDFSQWEDVQPALVGRASVDGDFIKKVYLAVDGEKLYMRFEIRDSRPSSLFHSNNFTTSHDDVSYGINIKSRDLSVNAVMDIYHQNSRRVVLNEHFGLGNNKRLTISEDYAMTGSTVVAAFPLKPIIAYLGSLAPGKHYSIMGFIWYRDGNVGPGTASDQTPTRDCVF